MTAAVVERVRAAAMGDDRVKGTVTPLAETLSEADAAVVARRVAEAIQAQRQQLQTLQGYHDDNRALCNVLVQLPDLVSYDIMVLHTHTPPFELLPFFLLSKLNFPLKNLHGGEEKRFVSRSFLCNSGKFFVYDEKDHDFSWLTAGSLWKSCIHARTSHTYK